MAEMVQKSRMESMFGGIFKLGDQGAVAPSRRKAAAAASGGGGGPSQASASSMPAPESCGIDPIHSDACILRIRRSHLMQDALEEIGRQVRVRVHGRQAPKFSRDIFLTPPLPARPCRTSTTFTSPSR